MRNLTLRRGVLSSLNSLKLEFVTPVFIKEKLLSRKITSNQWTKIYPYQKNTMKNENSVDSNYLISKT